MDERQVREAAKAQGYSTKQIDDAIKKSKQKKIHLINHQIKKLLMKYYQTIKRCLMTTIMMN